MGKETAKAAVALWNEESGKPGMLNSEPDEGEEDA
jgi:hypothetical protein